jgi:hypothetical protein
MRFPLFGPHAKGIRDAGHSRDCQDQLGRIEKRECASPTRKIVGDTDATAIPTSASGKGNHPERPDDEGIRFRQDAENVGDRLCS